MMAPGDHKVMRITCLIVTMGLLAAGCDAARPEATARPPAATPEDPDASTPSPENSPASQRSFRARTFLVWSPGGLPSGAAGYLKGSFGIEAATTVTAGVTWIGRASEGRTPPEGYEYPFEIAYVQPGPYARMMAGARNVSRSLLALRAGELLLAREAAELRGAGAGLRLNLESDAFRARGTLPERITNGYEALTAGRPPGGWGVSYVLVRAHRRAPIWRAVRGLLGAEARFRIKREGKTRFLRYADAVRPQLDFKLEFGEFPARPLADGRIEIEPAWRRAHIVSARLPLIGKATCHREFMPRLRAALRGIENAGLSELVIRNEFAGCYNARFIGSDPHGRLSSHAWGAAVDLNAASNPFGSQPTMDARLVRLMRRAGFNWGGDWLVPDGMHFEWGGAPTTPPDAQP